MADNIFQEIGGQLVGRVFSGMLWFIIGFILILVLFGVFYYFIIYKRKFDIRVKVVSERAEEKNKILWDKAAILRDRKTKTKYFRIWNLKADLPVPNFNVLQSSNIGDYLEIYRTAEDTFYFLSPPRIDKTQVIKADGKAYPIASQENKLLDADIAYWNVKRKEMNKSMFDTESLIMKLLPFIPHIIGGIITVFVLYILMDTLPEVLSQLKQLATELNSYKGAEIKTGLLWPIMMLKH